MQKSRTTRQILYALLVVLMLPTFYLIFNSGNPNSILRPILPPPEYDFIVTIVLGFCILMVSFTLTSLNSVDPITEILETNLSQIRHLRNLGKSDTEIADSFLKELKIRNPFSKIIIRRKTYRFLKELK